MNKFFGINPQPIEGSFLPDKFYLHHFWRSFFNIFWLRLQLKALKREGFASRLKALKRKINQL
jgi:hypothetical protein